jgi:hypothetical protein
MKNKRKSDEIIRQMGKQFRWESPNNNQEFALIMLNDFLRVYRKAKPDKHIELFYAVKLFLTFQRKRDIIKYVNSTIGGC